MIIENCYAEENLMNTESGQLPPAPDQIAPSWISSMIPMVLMIFVFYFLLIRPQEKKRKAQENLVNGVKKGEEVLTSSGIFGIVNKLNDNDNSFELQVAKDVNIKLLKNSIIDITSRKKIDNPNKENKTTKELKKN